MQGIQILLTISHSQVIHPVTCPIFILRVFHFLKTKWRGYPLALPNFYPWTVRPVTPMPMTRAIQDKSAGGIDHQYRVSRSILTNRCAFKGKQLFTLGAYGGPSRTSNTSKAEVHSGPFPEFTYNAFGFLSIYRKKASQTIKGFGRSFYLFIAKHAKLLCFTKILILPGKLNEFSRRATLPLTRPINV